MSIVACTECGHEVSTKAASCPHCGAPTPKEPIKDMLREPVPPGMMAALLVVGAVIVFIGIAVFSMSKQPGEAGFNPEAISQQPAPPPAPAPHYAARVGPNFGYRADASPADIQRGIASRPLVLISYRGRTAHGYEFVSSDGGPTATMISCTDPCEFVTTMDMTGQHVMPVDRGTIIWAALEDARNGFLDDPAPAASPHNTPAASEPDGA